MRIKGLNLTKIAPIIQQIPCAYKNVYPDKLGANTGRPLHFKM